MSRNPTWAAVQTVAKETGCTIKRFVGGVHRELLVRCETTGATRYPRDWEEAMDTARAMSKRADDALRGWDWETVNELAGGWISA